jgi:hypothetical protein
MFSIPQVPSSSITKAKSNLNDMPNKGNNVSEDQVNDWFPDSVSPLSNEQFNAVLATLHAEAYVDDAVLKSLLSTVQELTKRLDQLQTNKSVR